MKKRKGRDFDTLGQKLWTARFLAWWLIFSRFTPIFSKIEDWRSFKVTWPRNWWSFQNVLTYTCGVSFPRFFWGGEFEFGVKLMLISQLRSLTSSNDLQSSILLKIGVDLLKISHHAKNLANPSKNVEDMAITNFGPKVSKSPPPP